MDTSECVFCSIARDPVHPSPIYRDDRILVLRDINPKAPVHLLIIPNNHLAMLADLDSDQVPVVGYVFAVAAEMARREGVTQSGFRLVLNQGLDSGQEIEHLHVHLLAGHKLGSMG